MQQDDPFLVEARRQAPRAATGPGGDRDPFAHLPVDVAAEHRRRARYANEPTVLEQVGAAARGAGKAIAVDLPVGLARFVTAPLRAVLAPQTVEEARNPLVRGALTARGGGRQDESEAVHAALRTRAAGAQTPAEIAGEVARGLVMSGYDVTRAAIEAEGAEEKARAIANLALLGGLSARSAGAKGPRLTRAQVLERAAREERPIPERPAPPPTEEPALLSPARSRKPSDASSRPPDPELDRMSANIRFLRDNGYLRMKTHGSGPLHQ